MQIYHGKKYRQRKYPLPLVSTITILVSLSFPTSFPHTLTHTHTFLPVFKPLPEYVFPTNYTLPFGSLVSRVNLSFPTLSFPLIWHLPQQLPSIDPIIKFFPPPSSQNCQLLNLFQAKNPSFGCRNKRRNFGKPLSLFKYFSV